MIRKGTRVEIINAREARNEAAMVSNGEKGTVGRGRVGRYSVEVIRDNNSGDIKHGGYYIPLTALKRLDS